jgi:trigger factor
MTVPVGRNTMAGERSSVQVSVEESGPVERLLSITVAPERLEAERARSARELARKLRVPGFRPGKVPPGYVRKMYPEDVDREAFQAVIPSAYEEAIDREGIAAVGRPDFRDIRTPENEGLVFQARVDVRPEVELKKIEGLRVEVPRRPVTGEDVNRALENLRERASSFRVVEREARAGDFLVIDLCPVGPDGVPNEKGRKVNQPLELREGEIFPEFFHGLQGLGMGEEKEIEVAYPEDQGPEGMRGRSVRYSLRLKEVKERVLPELDDAFAAGVGDFESLEALNRDVERRLKEEEEHAFQREVRGRLVDALIQANPFPVPQSMVETLREAMVRDALGERYDEDTDDGDRIREEARRLLGAAAEREVRRILLFEAIQEREEIRVEDAEVENRLFEIASREGQPPERLRARLEERRGLESIRSALLEEKTVELLKSRSEIETVAAEESEASGGAGASAAGPRG